MSTLSDRLNTLNSWNSSTQTEQAPAQVQQAVQPNQTIYDMVKEYGKPYDYEKELQQAERNRKLGMLTDFVKSATDFGSALAGRRIFDNGTSATKQASDRMDKIRDIQRQGTVNYQNALLNARLKDAEIARNEAQRKAQLDLQRQQMANDQYWKQRAYDQNSYQFEKNQELSKQKLQQDQNQFEQRNAFTASENKKDRDSRERIATIGASRSTSSSSNAPVEFVGANGRKTILSKAASQAFAPVIYAKMQELVKNKPGVSPIEDVNLQFGESGTTADKTLNVVRKRLPDFPELQQWMEQMEALNSKYPNATAEDWEKIMRGEDPSIPTWSPDMEQQQKTDEKKEQDYIMFDPNATSGLTDIEKLRKGLNENGADYLNQLKENRSKAVNDSADIIENSEEMKRLRNLIAQGRI